MEYFRKYLGTFHKVLFLALLAGALACLARTFGGRPVAVAGAAAVVVYLFSYYVFHWTVPRRHSNLPALIVCFTGALLFYLGGRALGLDALRQLIGPALTGAFFFLYIAVKVGVSSNLTFFVCCDGVSSNLKIRDASGNVDREREEPLLKKMVKRGILRKARFEPQEVESNKFAGPKGPPWVWPYFFEVAQEGILTWHLCGKKDTDVRIVFDQGFDPFSFTEPSEFSGKVPGVIVAGPVVHPGRGKYKIIVTEPSGLRRTLIVNDGGGSQDKHS